MPVAVAGRYMYRVITPTTGAGLQSSAAVSRRNKQQRFRELAFAAAPKYNLLDSTQGEAMTTLLLAEREDTIFINACRLRVRDRLEARLLTWRLDGLLARGASPDSTPALSLRARRLIGRRERRVLAESLRRVQREARRRRHPWDVCVPICGVQVQECDELIDELSERLTEAAPVHARGVALARLIVSDGSSPLYTRGGAGLERALQDAISAIAFELD